MRKKKGFTLVELLAVIVIIAFMVAVLLPALRTARQKADAMACASNLRQIGTAIASYCADNDGYYPHVPALQMSADRRPSSYSWWSVLSDRGYLAKEQGFDAQANEFPDQRPGAHFYPTRIFQCRSQSSRDTHPVYGRITGMMTPTSYGMNVLFDSWVMSPDAAKRTHCAYYTSTSNRLKGYGRINEDAYNKILKGYVLPNGTRVYMPARDSTVQQGSEKFLVADTNYRVANNWIRNWSGALTHNQSVGGYAFAVPFYGHPGSRANVLFCDYHVGTIKSNDDGVCLLPEKMGFDRTATEWGLVDKLIPGPFSTKQKFWHWAPFCIRNNWDQKLWKNLYNEVN